MPTSPLILFAHGAGAGIAHPWMQAWAARLGRLGRVVPFDYPYMREGRRAPNRLPALIDAHRAALAEASEGHAGPVFLAGKSMGSRVGCHLALEEAVSGPGSGPVRGLVCFGYPLRSTGKRAAVRDEVLVALRTPILFVSGTRDSLCPLDLLASVRARMTAESELYVVEAGNHSLEVTKTRLKETGQSQGDVDEEILGEVTRFIEARRLD